MNEDLHGENAAGDGSSSGPSVSSLCHNCTNGKEGSTKARPEDPADAVVSGRRATPSCAGFFPKDVSACDISAGRGSVYCNCQGNFKIPSLTSDSGVSLSYLEVNSNHNSASQELTEDPDTNSPPTDTDNPPTRILVSNLSDVMSTDSYNSQVNSEDASVVRNEVCTGSKSSIGTSTNNNWIEQLEIDDAVSRGEGEASASCFISRIVKRKLEWFSRYLKAPVPERQGWANQMDSVVSLVAYTVGLGNMWRFPYLCYKHGGVTFLIPYGVCLLIIGLPDYFIDISLGQYLSLGPTNVYANIAPLFSGLGWAMVTSTVLVSLYYNVVLAWTVMYIYSSFNSTLPWTHCDNPFNTEDCITESGTNSYLASEQFFTKYVLRRHDTGIDETNSSSYRLHPTLVCSLALSWMLVVLSLVRGIRSSGKVVYVTVTFPYLILILLLTWSYLKFKPDVWKNRDGVEITPLQIDPTKLRKADIWTDAAVQALFSLGQGFGGHVTLASYNKIHQNTLRSSILIVMWDTGTSILCGCAVFMSLGALANELNVSVGDIFKNTFEGLGVEVVFIAYPVLLGYVGSPAWAILFFLMIFALGIDSVIGQVETITTSLFDNFIFLRRRFLPLVFVVCLLLFLFELPLCTSVGFELVEIMHVYTCKASMLILCFLKIFVVCYVYGFSKLMKLIRDEMRVPVPKFMEYYLRICLMVLGPLALWALLLHMIFYEEPVKGVDLPMKYRGIGWFLAISSCLIVPIGAVWVLYKNRDRHWRELLIPTKDFRPRHLRRESSGPSQYNMCDNDSIISYLFGRRLSLSSDKLPPCPPATETDVVTPSDCHQKPPEFARRYTV